GVTMSSGTMGSFVPTTCSATGEAATPARNSSESPGKKKPTSSPVSAKMMAQTPMRPKLSISCLGLSRLPRLSLRARVFSAVSMGPRGTGHRSDRNRWLLGAGGGRLALEQAGLVPLRLVRRLAAPQSEQPLGQQQVQHGRHVDGQRADPDPGDLLGQ